MTLRRALCVVSFVGAAAACSSSASTEAPVGTKPASTTMGPASWSLSTPCSDAIDAIYGTPGALDKARGDVLKCARGATYSRNDVQAILDASGFKGPAATSGAATYRILYRTERATEPPSAGYASAVVLLPDNPRVPGRMPTLSVSHGAAGQSPACTQSRQRLEEPKSDFAAMAMGMVSAGFPVVGSDYAGFNDYGARGNPPSGMAFSADVARSTLDSVRALKRLVPDAIGDDVYLVGQSQGGHTVLSTLALAGDLAPEVSIAGVVAYTPLWINQASWGGIFFLGDAFALAKDPFPTTVGLWYLYSHGAILDGEDLDVAAEVFKADKRPLIKQYFDETCGGSNDAFLQNIAKIPADLYDPDFVSGIEASAALGEPCPTGSSRQAYFCQKWMPRFLADRPHISGKAANTPILLGYGGNDRVLPPERAMCGIERLQSDKSNLTVCFDKNATHSSIVRSQGGYAAAWIAHLAFEEPAPAEGCDGDAAAIVDADGLRVRCASLPPND